MAPQDEASTRSDSTDQVCPLCSGSVLHAQKPFPPNPMDDGGIELFWSCNQCYWTSKDTQCASFHGHLQGEIPVFKNDALGWWYNARMREPSVYSELAGLVDRADEPLADALASAWLTAHHKLAYLHSSEDRIRGMVGNRGPRDRPENERRFLRAFDALQRTTIPGRKGGVQYRLNDGTDAGDVWRRNAWGNRNSERTPKEKAIHLLDFFNMQQWIVLHPQVTERVRWSRVRASVAKSMPAAGVACLNPDTFLDRFADAFLACVSRDPHPEDCAPQICQWLVEQPAVRDLFVTDAGMASVLREM